MLNKLGAHLIVLHSQLNFWQKISECGCQEFQLFRWLSDTLFDKKHHNETGKDHIGVQREHRLERNVRGDDSQALHGKTPAGEYYHWDKRSDAWIFRTTMRMHRKQLSAATHITTTMRSKKKICGTILVYWSFFLLLCTSKQTNKWSYKYSFHNILT